MAVPRILTFNFHEPYLALMAKTGLPFDVGQYRQGTLARKWHTHYRPVPQNMRLVDEPVWREDLSRDRYDVVIAHNESNALDLLPYARTPMLLVCHNRKTFLKTTVTSPRPDSDQTFERLLERLRQQFQFIFISQSKKDDYGIDGLVIPPGIDVEDYGGYTGETSEVLRVGNLMRVRNLMFDVDFQDQACRDLPCSILGVNPLIPASREAGSFDDLLDHYRRLRCLLHVTREAYEDGYNLSSLEAMATGMPVVALANATCPLTDGVDGFVASDADALRERLMALLNDPALAREIGARGRETVQDKFPIQAFADRWREAIERAADEGAKASRLNAYYCNERPEIAQLVPFGTQRLLDVGCGAGQLGRLLKKQGLKEVHGLEIVHEACEIARQHLDSAVEADIESEELPFDDGFFDCITFADVLEHLHDPVMALRKAARVLAPCGCMIMSIPNVRFYEVVSMLAAGRWKYEEAGILDRTHLRFFTAVEMQQMVEAAGLSVLRLAPLSYVEEDKLPRDANGAIRVGRITIEPLNDADAADLRTYQYLLIAGHPDADRLAQAREALEAGHNDIALRMAEEAYGVDEFERAVLMAKAAVHLQQLEMAQQLYTKALSLRPRDGQVSGRLGILLVAMGRYDEAEPRLERALHADPENDRALGALGLVHLARGDMEEAFDLLSRATKEGLDNVSLVTALCQCASSLGRLDDIEPVVRRYAEFYPANVQVACEYARILIYLNRQAEAADRLELVLVFAPDHEQARRLLDMARNG